MYLRTQRNNNESLRQTALCDVKEYDRLLTRHCRLAVRLSLCLSVTTVYCGAQGPCRALKVVPSCSYRPFLFISSDTFVGGSSVVSDKRQKS